MMAWVAFDRAVMLADQFSYDAPTEKWKTVRDAIHAEICKHAFHRGKNSFIQRRGIAPDAPRSIFGIPVFAHRGLSLLGNT